MTLFVSITQSKFVSTKTKWKPQTITATVEATVHAPVEKVWKYWTGPQHIKSWNNASDDWHTTRAENDLIVGGIFSFRMEAKNRSFGFDFGGTYDAVKENEYIEYTLGDGAGKLRPALFLMNGIFDKKNYFRR